MAEFIPVDHDPFAPAPSGDGSRAPLRITVNPQQKRKPELVPVDHDPFASSTLSDVAKAVPSGIAKGIIDLAGLPDTVSKLWAQAGDHVLDAIESTAGLPKGWAAETKKFIQMGREQGAMSGLPSAAGIRKTVEENVTGPLYEPQTMPGKFAGTVAEMVPGAGRRLITQALMPGVASEAAGQVAEKVAPEYAPVARGVGAVAGGVAGAPFARPSSADAAVRNYLPNGGIDDATMNQAARLMDDAANRGVQLTWAEALEQSAPGTGLTNLQRLVERMPEGRAVLAPVIAQRPGQMNAAARQTFDTVAPPNYDPSQIGRGVGQAAEGYITDVRGAINQASEPYYRAAEATRIQPADMGRIRMMPGWNEARDAIRNDPQLNRYVAHLPDNSVGFVNEVKKHLDTAAENAASPINQQRNMQRSAGYGRDAETARSIAQAASPEYAQALAMQAQMREQYLEPLLQGQLGKIAANSAETRNVINALFPKQALPNSEREIGNAVGILAQRNPRATMGLIRAYAEGVFNQAARQIQSGDNAYGAASFAAAISGQQRANLRAAIEASGPGGAQVWRGFERFLEIAEASGKRLREGAPTATDIQGMKDLSSGTGVANTVKNLGSPGKWPSLLSDAWSRWQLGSNVDEVARLLVDNGARNRLRAIASVPEGSQSAWNLAGQLALKYSQGYLDAGKSSDQPR